MGKVSLPTPPKATSRQRKNRLPWGVNAALNRKIANANTSTIIIVVVIILVLHKKLQSLLPTTQQPREYDDDNNNIIIAVTHTHYHPQIQLPSSPSFTPSPSAQLHRVVGSIGRLSDKGLVVEFLTLLRVFSAIFSYLLRFMFAIYF
jgi:hypothetical protein